MKRRIFFRNLMVLAVVLTGMVLALPNLASDPALHVSSEDGSPIAQVTVDAMRAELANAGVAPVAAHMSSSRTAIARSVKPAAIAACGIQSGTAMTP